MNRLLLVALAVMAVAISAKELSKAAKEQIIKSKELHDSFKTERSDLIKKYPKEVYSEILKELKEQGKLKKEAEAASKKKGSEVKPPPMRLSWAAWGLHNALVNQEKAQDKRKKLFGKSIDPKVTQEIKEYLAESNVKAAQAADYLKNAPPAEAPKLPGGKPAAKPTAKPAGKKQ